MRLSTDRERTPLLTPAGAKLLEQLREHPDAPRFNYATGDRLRTEDLPAVEFFREGLHEARVPGEPVPSPQILLWVSSRREQVPWFRQHIPPGLDLAKDWASIPTSSRADLAAAPWDFVPDNQPLDRLIIYRTAGTTGHPITVPHHPLAIRYYEPLLDFVLAQHGVRPSFSPDRVGCFLVGAQIRTYTYAAILSNWNGAGFAKLNIRQTEWPHDGSQHRYFGTFLPQLLTGDPISFAEMLRMDLPAAPLALVSTSVAMSPTLKQKLSQKYHAPVIDWYSLVETGPIGYGAPDGRGFLVLPHDLYVEVVRPDGSPTPAGERGEITVTGGRNPFCPLLRYRTGDFGRMEFTPVAGQQDPQPRILDLEGRAPVLIRSFDATPVSTVDISRLLREYPLLMHEFTQHADRSCELVVRPLPNIAPQLAEIEQALRRVLGDLPLEIRVDPQLGDRLEGKVLAYRSDLLLED